MSGKITKNQSMKIRFIYPFIMSMLIIISSPLTAENKINVVVSIVPQIDFVEKIGRDKVNVSVMIPPGANPHVFEPRPGQFKQLVHSDIYFMVGSELDFELIWMDKIRAVNKDLSIYDCSKGIKLLQDHNNTHHNTDHCSHNRDPHIWLSPDNAVIIATNIRDALIKTDPENKMFYTRNAHDFILEIYSLKKDISLSVSRLVNKKFIVFHPSWSYFAQNFGLEQIAIEVDGKEASAKYLTQIIKKARKHNIKTIFASPQFNIKSARIVAKEINGSVVLIDPLAKDYINNLNKIKNIFANNFYNNL